jgi:sugar phosphate isomerase/epimerase
MSFLHCAGARGFSARRLACFIMALLLLGAGSHAEDRKPGGVDMTLLARSNLAAWCIVPFDAKNRGPEERARMLAELGLRRLAYDWRAEHIPTFDEEIAAMRRHGIEITAWWVVPDGRDVITRTILEVCKRNNLQTQFWTLIPEPLPGSTDQGVKVRVAAEKLRPLAEEAAKIGCTVALYNHGGWFGEPENQIAIIQELNLPNVGLVYNFHHGHHQIERFPEMFAAMKPHLLALNLNGMIARGDEAGHKILHLAEGDQELSMLKVVLESGWKGPVGILDHRDETDSRETLRLNLQGLDWLIAELQERGSGGPRPFKVPEPTRRSSGAGGFHAHEISAPPFARGPHPHDEPLPLPHGERRFETRAHRKIP